MSVSVHPVRDDDDGEEATEASSGSDFSLNSNESNIDSDCDLPGMILVCSRGVDQRMDCLVLSAKGD